MAACELQVVENLSGAAVCTIALPRSLKTGAAVVAAVEAATSSQPGSARLLWAGSPLEDGPLHPGVRNPDGPPMRLVRIEPEWKDALDRCLRAGDSGAIPLERRDLFGCGFPKGPEDDALLQNRAFVLAALQDSGSSLRLAAPALQGDREAVLTAVRETGTALLYAAPALRADAEVVEVAVRRDGLALEHATEELRADPSIVSAAVEETGEALKFAKGAALKNQGVVIAAVRQSANAIKHVRWAMLEDREFMLQCMRANGGIWNLLPAKFKSDKEFALAAKEFWSGKGEPRHPQTMSVRVTGFLGST